MHHEESNNQFWAILDSLRMLLISEGESEMQTVQHMIKGLSEMDLPESVEYLNRPTYQFNSIST